MSLFFHQHQQIFLKLNHPEIKLFLVANFYIFKCTCVAFHFFKINLGLLWMYRQRLVYDFPFGVACICFEYWGYSGFIKWMWGILRSEVLVLAGVSTEITLFSPTVCQFLLRTQQYRAAFSVGLPWCLKSHIQSFSVCPLATTAGESLVWNQYWTCEPQLGNSRLGKF